MISALALVVGGLIFGAGWALRGWYDADTIAQLLADRDAARRAARRLNLFEQRVQNTRWNMVKR